MDWKYKHFDQAALFQASRESVLEAVSAVAGESFRAWQVQHTPDGFVARGNSAWHAATATFHTESTPDGTKVTVELLVERATLRGFMLFDVGGYYNGQIQKWMSAISRRLGQPTTDSTVGRGCLTGLAVSFIVGLGLVLFAIPFDHAVFPQASDPVRGPFSTLGSMIGFMAGIVTFIYVGYPEAWISKSIRERLPGMRKETRP